MAALVVMLVTAKCERASALTVREPMVMAAPVAMLRGIAILESGPVSAAGKGVAVPVAAGPVSMMPAAMMPVLAMVTSPLGATVLALSLVTVSTSAIPPVVLAIIRRRPPVSVAVATIPASYVVETVVLLPATIVPRRCPLAIAPHAAVPSSVVARSEASTATRVVVPIEAPAALGIGEASVFVSVAVAAAARFVPAPALPVVPAASVVVTVVTRPASPLSNIVARMPLCAQSVRGADSVDGAQHDQAQRKEFHDSIPANSWQLV